jgi:fluoride ion exporter CrcB/FEX
LNRYAEERGMRIRTASGGMMLGGIILNLVGCSPIGLILQLLAMNSIKNAAMDVAAAKGV